MEQDILGPSTSGEAPNVNPPSLVDMIFSEQASGAGERPTGNDGSGSAFPESLPQDWEKLARIHQSERDKVTARLKEVEPMVTDYQELKQFFNALETDEEVRQAFIHQLAPDLVKPKDPQTFIKEKLAKEFGKDFEPNDEEAETFGSKTWLYYKRADQLVNSAFDDSKVAPPKTLEKLREELKAILEKQQGLQKQAKQEILQKFPQWNEQIYNDFLTWGKNAKESDFATIYNYMILKAQHNNTNRFNAPSISGIPGNPVLPNETMNRINQMFGNN